MADDIDKPQQPESEDIYEESGIEEGSGVEEGGAGEGVFLTPGAPGVRSSRRAKKVEEKIEEQGKLLKELKDEIRGLHEVVQGLKSNIAEGSEAFSAFNKDFKRISDELSFEFRKISSALKKGFGRLVSDIDDLGSESEDIVRDVVGNLALNVRNAARGLSDEVKRVQSDLRRKLKQYDVESKRARRRLSFVGKERDLFGLYGGMRLRRKEKDLFDLYGSLWFGKGKEKSDKWWKGSSRWGRYGGWHLSEVKSDIKNIALASIFGPLSPFVSDVIGRIWESESVEKLKKKSIAKLWKAKRRVVNRLKYSLGIGRYRGKEIGEEEFGDDFSRKVKVERVVLRRRRVNDVGSDIGGGKVIEFPIRYRVSEFPKQASTLFSEVSYSTAELLRKTKVVELKDAELVQEKGAKIHADKLYIQAKGGGGEGGGSGLLETAFEVMVGGKVLGKLGGVFGKLGGKLGGLGKLKLLGQLGAVAPRLLGCIGPLAGAAMSLFSGIQEGDFLKGLFRAGGTLGGMFAGGKVGAAIGAAIGTVIAPGVGTAIGSALGGMLGSVVGGISGEDLMDAVYSGMKKLIKDKDWVNSLKAGFSDVISMLGSFLSDLWNRLKEGFGWVKEKGKKAAEWAGEKLKSGKEWIREKFSSLYDWAKKALESGVGVVAREAEAGVIDMKKSAGVVGMTKGDAGGMSLGMYQFTEPTAREFLKRYGYEKEFEGLRFGTKEFAQKWKELAQRDESFAKAQHEFAVEKYLLPGAEVAERYGIDVTKSRALQEMVFARALQHGVGGFKSVLQNVFGGMNPEQVSAMSEKEIIDKVYDHIVENVDKYFRSSSPAVRESVRKRLLREKEELEAMVEAEKEVRSEASKQFIAQKRVTQETENLAMSIEEHSEIQQQVSQEAQKLSSLLEQQSEAQERVVKETESLALALGGAREIQQQALYDAQARLALGRFGGVDPGMGDWVEVPGAVGSNITSFQNEIVSSVLGVLRGLMSGVTMPVQNVMNDISRIVGGVSEVVRSVRSDTGRVGIIDKLQRVVASTTGAFNRMIGNVVGAVDRMIGSAVSPVNQFGSEVRGVAKGMTDITTGISDLMSGLLGGRGAWGIGNVPFGISNLIGNLLGGRMARVMDTGLVSMQSGIQQRVIDTDVRRGAVEVEAIGEAVVGGIGSAKMRGPGGSERVTMSGGEAFKNVPLYVDDLGILMMQLGLV